MTEHKRRAEKNPRPAAAAKHKPGSKSVSFATFLRYGVPFTLCQLAVAALYVLGLFYCL